MRQLIQYMKGDNMKAIGEYIILREIKTTTDSGLITGKQKVATVVSVGESVPEEVAVNVKEQKVYFANKFPEDLGDGLTAIRYTEIIAVVK